MAAYCEQQIQDLSRQFHIYGEILHAEPCKIGHINETYTATYDQGGAKVRYIHQRINRTVFKDPVAVMDNVVRVTSHIRSRLSLQGSPEITRRTLIIVPARDGKPYYRDPTGEYWRTFVFVENTQSYEAVQNPRQAFEAGRAFGEFQSFLVDLPGARLVETIPDFHNTRKRFEALESAISADHCNRAKDAAAEIEFAFKHEPIVDVLLSAHSRGDIPERVTHNDTKFNNVMLDTRTGQGMCVVDLDTVMPGLVLYDFGDMIRTTTSPTREDEQDLSKVRVQMPVFKELARGYLSSAHQFLSPSERSYLAFSGRLITFTIGLRFLTDFLAGDKYFRIHRAGHNLDRCRTQFQLVRSIERHEEEMQSFIDAFDGA